MLYRVTDPLTGLPEQITGTVHSLISQQGRMLDDSGATETTTESKGVNRIEFASQGGRVTYLVMVT